MQKKIIFLTFLILQFIWAPYSVFGSTKDCCLEICGPDDPLTCNGKIIDICDFCDNAKYYYYRCSQVSCHGKSLCTDFICNKQCGANCTVAQDPDCGCQGGNSCCGRGCNSVNDNDCKTLCIADGCNKICPKDCTAAQDPDCGSAGCCGDKVCDKVENNAVCPADCATMEKKIAPALDRPSSSTFKQKIAVERKPSIGDNQKSALLKNNILFFILFSFFIAAISLLLFIFIKKRRNSQLPPESIDKQE